MQVAFRPLDEIEQEAQSLLAWFACSKGWSPAPPVPIEKLINYLGLHQEILDLYDFLDVEREEETDLLGALSFRRRTIYVHAGLDPDNHPHLEGRFHFTLSHEIGHWVLHREQFFASRQQHSLFSGASGPDIVCRKSARAEPIEFQANQFASCTLLPRNLVTQFLHSMDDGCDITVPEGIDRIVRQVSAAFCASIEATRIRLNSLGVLEAQSQQELAL